MNTELGNPVHREQLNMLFKYAVINVACIFAEHDNTTEAGAALQIFCDNHPTFEQVTRAIYNMTTEQRQFKPLISLFSQVTNDTDDGKILACSSGKYKRDSIILTLSRKEPIILKWKNIN